MIIPPEKLDKEALQNILESYVLRDGTDYGDQELTLEEKVERLRPRVMAGEVLILYDQDSESLTLCNQEDYRTLTPP